MITKKTHDYLTEDNRDISNLRIKEQECKSVIRGLELAMLNKDWITVEMVISEARTDLNVVITQLSEDYNG